MFQRLMIHDPYNPNSGVVNTKQSQSIREVRALSCVDLPQRISALSC